MSVSMEDSVDEKNIVSWAFLKISNLFQQLFNLLKSFAGFPSFIIMEKMEQQKYAERAGNVWYFKNGRGYKEGWELNKELKAHAIDTITKLWEYGIKKYSKNPCFATRKLLKRDIITENGKNLEKLTLGDYDWKTYENAGNSLKKLANGLLSMNLGKGDKLAIFSETREEWLLGAFASLRIGITVVTLYSTLSNPGVVSGICESEVETVMVSYETLPRVLEILSSCPNVKRLIVFEDQLSGMGNLSNLPDSVNAIPFSKLLLVDGRLPQHPNPDDLAIIMYTSGSTGIPKGVEITHDNAFAAVQSYIVQIECMKNDRYLAFLPLAHIMELCCEVSQIAVGSTIAYSSPHTLTTASPKIAKGVLGDAIIAKPTKICAVPLILDRIVKKISEKVCKSSILKQKLFFSALETKQVNEHCLLSKIYDIIIFKKVRAEMGGRLRNICAGGAPVNPNTQKIIRALFGCSIQVGFGCTETTCSATVMEAVDSRAGHCGGPNPHNFIRLEDWEEGEYFVSDKPLPRGEVIVGGRSVSSRYYKNEEETNGAFFQENNVNWFRTGDIGEIDESGVLRIIDRKKNLVKLKNGEYVSLGGVEATLKTHKLVENICVFAYSTEEYTVGIVIPSEALLDNLQKFGLGCYISLEKVCQETKVVDFLCKELQIYGQKNSLNKWDIPKKLFLTVEPWTPENELVTASMKIRRKNIEKLFKNEINILYS